MNMAERKQINKPLLWRILLRSFFLQCSWNFERLQGLGFLYVILPALRILYTEEDLAAACQRHLKYFNTHPYLSSMLIGATIQLEEKESRGENVIIKAEDFKQMAMAPVSAMGDSFFWGAVRPAAAITALFFAFHGSLAAPFIFLLIFNVPHLLLRTSGIFIGYSRGLGVLEFIQKLHLADAAVRVKEAGIVLLGGLMAFLTWRYLGAENLSHIWGISLLPLLGLLLILVRRGITVPVLIGTGTLVILVLPEIYIEVFG